MRLLFVAATVALAVAATAAAAPVTWEPVEGTVARAPADAARDGAGVLVLSKYAGVLSVARVAHGRVGAAQVLARTRRLRQARVVVTPQGSAVIVWSINGEILAARRPTRAGRFGTARTISRHPGAATGAAAGPKMAVAPDGRILVAWWGGPAGGRLGIQTTELGTDGRWSAPVDATGGTYPAVGGSPPLAAAYAPAPDADWTVAWAEATGPGSLGPAALVTAHRGASGSWQAPVSFGAGSGAASIAPASGRDLVAAWPERGSAAVCLVTARWTPLALTRRLAACAPDAVGVGAPPALARTTVGGSVAAWPTGAAAPGVLALARPPGSDEWSAPRLAVADSRGTVEVEALMPLAGGGGALVTLVVSPVFPRDLGRVGVTLLGPGGEVSGRHDGPPTPGRPRSTVVTFLPTGSVSAPQGVLTWTASARTDRHRMSLLRIAP